MWVRLVLVVSVIFSLLGSKSYSQNTDSLYQIFQNSNYPDTVRLQAVNTLSELSLYNNPDTAIWFANRSIEFAKKTNNKIWQARAIPNIAYAYQIKGDTKREIEQYLRQQKIFRQLNNQKGIAFTFYSIAGVYERQNNPVDALKYYEIALHLYKVFDNKPQIANIYMSMGGIFEREGNYAEGLKSFLNELKYCEQINDDYRLAKAYNDLGTVYKDLKEYNKALDFLKRALALQIKVNDKEGIGYSYNNIGINYMYLHQYEDALKNCQAALEIRNKIGDKFRIGYTYLNIGLIYSSSKNQTAALENYFSAAKAFKEVKSNAGLADAYSGISKAYLRTGKYKDAEQYALDCRKLAIETGALETLQEANQTLSEVYENTNKPALALAFHKAYIAIRDSIFSEANTKKFVQSEMSFDFEKKEAIAKAEQDKLDAIQEEKSKQQRMIIIFVSLGLLLLVAFSIFIYNRFKITQKQKAIIELQKIEVDKQRELADSRRIIAEEQKEIIHEQKKLVDEKQKEIIDSIHYAQRIQQAMLTSDTYISDALAQYNAECFILYKPKDVVAGDFYWAFNAVASGDMESQNKFTYIATADCTGHGIPGAFMSLLNISFLNENVIERSIQFPHEILNKQRKEIIKALNPKGNENVKDGMDCVLCAFDFEDNKLHFAAANNPLCLVRHNELTDYKANKMAVGKSEKENESFTLQTIDLQKGDLIYTYSDGYPDQFGKGDKKLKSKNLKEMLLKIHQQPMNEQREYLDKFIEEWMSGVEQTDDILVIGVKI